MNPSTAMLVLRLLDLAVLAATKGPSILRQMGDMQEQVARMVSEGRDPTAAEVDALNARLEELRSGLHED